jgi:hypothetical protein
MIKTTKKMMDASKAIVIGSSVSFAFVVAFLIVTTIILVENKKKKNNDN